MLGLATNADTAAWIESQCWEEIKNHWPRPLTSGAIPKAYWTKAINNTTSKSEKFALLYPRWEHAVYDARIEDMQTTLAMWRQTVPDRKLTLAWAALSQMLADRLDERVAELNQQAEQMLGWDEKRTEQETEAKQKKQAELKTQADQMRKMAMLVARKAVSEKWDDDKDLDCRVPGQIFALQGSWEDLDSIRDRPAFTGSKEVWKALKSTHVNGTSTEGES
jgi:N-terminal acetyltransferase B complex non-catalytic subunit